MRVVAKKMRTQIEEMEEDKVDVRKEDKTIRPFVIPAQPEIIGDLLTISSFTTMDPKTHQPKVQKKSIILKRREHLLLKGPNGIGKTTLLESLANGTAEGAEISKGVRVGYYRQDFSTLNFDHTVRESLLSVMEKHDEERMRAVAACGHADWLKCRYCKKWESVENLIIYKANSPHHLAWRRNHYLNRSKQ